MRLKFLGLWRDLTGVPHRDEELYSGMTLLALLNHLALQDGEDFRRLIVREETETLWGNFSLAVNGKLIQRFEKLGRTRLEDGDEVTFLFPITGDSGRPSLSRREARAQEG